MSIGMNVIDNKQIKELKQMVENIISDYQIISDGHSKFNIFEHLDEKLIQCHACSLKTQRINALMDSIITDISKQIVGLGNFTISILDNLNSVNQITEQNQFNIKFLENNKQRMTQHILQIQVQNNQKQNENQYFKSKIIELQEIIAEKQIQIKQIQIKYQELKMSKIMFQNTLTTLKNQTLCEKNSKIQTLQTQVNQLKDQNLAITAQKGKLESQILHLNQQLQNHQSLQISSNLSKSRKIAHSCENFLIIDEDLPLRQHSACYFNQSPFKEIASNSLQKQVGSDKVFNFFINSPQIQKFDQNCNLQIKSRDIYRKLEQDKENTNTIINKAIIDENLLKNISKQSKQIEQVCFSNRHSLKIENKKYLKEKEIQNIKHNKQSTEQNIKQQKKNQNEKIFNGNKRQQPLFTKLVNYLSQKCIHNRIKIKNKSILMNY